MSRVILNQTAIRSLRDDPGVKAGLGRAGDQVADRAASLAPKRTGAGAASISAEMGEDGDGAYDRVTWDAAHYYMFFQEVGTSKMSARPFLRPALDGSFTL